MCPLEGAKGQGPPVAIGPSNGTRQRMRSEDHVKMQRPRTRGVTLAGEMKRRVTQRCLMRQTSMMARHFKSTALTLQFLCWVWTFRRRLPSLNGMSSNSPALHLPQYYSSAEEEKRELPLAPCILPPPPPPSDPLPQERSAVGASWAARTSQRCRPSGRPELEVLCALGHRRGAERTAPP
jgi:hypothetical protein